MAVKREFSYASADGRTKIHGVEWKPEAGEPKAVLQIFHGMVEYIERYEEFASYLTEKGLLVVGNDHLGHGGSIVNKEDYGYFAEKNGNGIVLRDLRTLHKRTAKRYPELPIIYWATAWDLFCFVSICAVTVMSWTVRLSWEPEASRWRHCALGRTSVG